MSHHLCVIALVLALLGCGGGGSATGGGSPSADPSVGIVGLPSGPSNAATLSLVLAGGGAAVSIDWWLESDAGTGPVVVGSGTSVNIAPPEGVSRITARVTFAGGIERVASGTVSVDRTAPVLRIATVAVSGSTSVTAAATVGGVQDQDGALDEAFRVAFTCDGGDEPYSLPVDAGGGQRYDLGVTIDGRSHAVVLELD